MLTDLDSPPRDDDERPSDRGSLVSSHQDPFNLLATEIIGDIFSYAYSFVNIPTSILQKGLRINSISNPCILSLVCKRWHAITMANHSLWATLSIGTSVINQDGWNAWGFLQLREYLERSGTHPLSIRISDGLDGYEDAVVSGILDIIMLHSERWKSICFGFPLEHEAIRKLDLLRDRLPLLEHLDIDLTNYRYLGLTPPCTAFLTASKLTSLHITPSSDSVIISKIRIPWAQISCATISGGNFDTKGQLFEILSSLSGSLTSLTVSCESEGWPWTYMKPLILPRLRRLHFSSYSFDMLDVLICPSLEELEVDSAFTKNMTTFLDLSSCALTHIKSLDLFRVADSLNYHTTLQHSSLSTLKSISLSETIVDPGPIMDILNFDSYQLFPFLESLHLRLRWSKNRSGQQLLLSQLVLEGIRKIVDSRTRATTLNQPESFVHGFNSNEVQPASRSSLKKCLFQFYSQRTMGGVDDYRIEELIVGLRSFCISRGILLSLEIS